MVNERMEERHSGAGDDQAPGETPLLVAGHLDAWWCWVALGIAVIAGAVALAAFLLRHPAHSGLTAVSVMALLASGAGFALQFCRRSWLTWTRDAFQVTGRLGTFEILDEQVQSLAVTREYRHAVGRIVAEAHRLWLWTALPEPRVYAFEARELLGEASPFLPLVDRLQQRLETRALAELRHEGAIRRPGWGWQEGVVTITTASPPAVIPVSEMSAVDNDIADVRIWIASDPLPAARIAQSSPDVWLLGKMLASAVGAPGEEGVAPASGLGRILYESRPRSAAIMATMLSGLSAAVAVVAVLGAILLRLPPLAILAAGTGMGAIMLGSTSRRLWRCAFRLHELGISQRSLTGERSLKFAEIDQFVYDARRQYSKGRYLGTLFTMVFASDRHPRHGILHSERCAYETDEIARVRDYVSEEIAAAMAAKLASSGELAWTRELTIGGGRLHCQPRRILRRSGQPQSADLSGIRGFDLADGWFYVWTSDRERPLFRARTAEPNFYPGLLIFERILDGAEASRLEAGPRPRREGA